MVYSSISVLVPTRHRIERLKALLASFAATTTGHAEIVFRVDDDDDESFTFLRRGGWRVVSGSRHRGYDSMPQFFNELYAASLGDVLMSGNDDFVFRTGGWDYKILEATNAYPDGVFNVGVQTLNADHYPFGITSRKLADHLGFYWDPTIFWGDIYLRDIVQYFGRLVMLSDVHIEHDWAGLRPDATFNAGHRDPVARDPTYWEVTHANAVNSAIERMKSLYDQHLCART